ncbi:xanthine dehydrogenase family protein molybdopterin-binding subunit [Aquabacterium sp.]|uniref:xanthine dehydrogenase family protein molybdopterin-binding subunit n=1 Tax=Aquabacterium sp. TaxID=1872578 RepID=UPI002C400E53|nr:molybdopterin cofactor-binding domain-containing protein [Aquabacterium sp.]HSW04068.1 molybdopterin cofactor-binding domain-containing protein [Aquabacterium sp.]
MSALSSRPVDKDAVDDAVEDQQALALSRRQLLTYAVSGPVLTVAAGFGANLALPSTAAALPLPLTPPDTVDYYDIGDSIVQTSLPTMPLVKLTVGLDGRVTLDLPRLETGTGIATACGMMVAEEMDVPLSAVEVSSADANPALVFNQITGGSSTMRCFSAALPLIAAAARARLVAAAAQQWGLSASTLKVVAGVVVAPDGRTAAYGALTALASSLPLPVNVPPKPASQYTLIGKPARRLDALAIVTGQKKFTMDQAVPNAKPTMLRMPTQIRGTVVRVNNLAAVQAMPGVLAVVVIPTGGSIVPNPPGVAVMAETFGQAWTACNALDVTWGDGPLKGQSNASIQARLKAAIAPLAVPPLGALTVEGEFEFAAATHAPLEVECAIADVRADRAEIWAGLQTPIVAQQSIAADLGLPQNKVTVHVVPSGGSFGRRLFWDPVQVAAQVSRLTGRVCKLMYHRANDVRHTRLRPPQFHKVRATLLLGQVISFEQRVAAVRLDARHGFGEMFSAAAGAAPPGVQQSIGNLAYEQVFFKTMVASPYNFGVGTKVLTPVAIDMNTVSYRSVHIQPARSVEEIMVDEIAKKLNKDPLAFRLEYLRLPRAKAVLQAVAGAAGWGKAMPAGFAQGCAVHQESRSFTACIVELDARVPSDIKVTRATIAIDVGMPINPSGIDAQVQGALAEAISLVLTAGLHIQDGLPLEGSYSQYHFARNRNYPKDVKVIIMPANGGAIGGLGEVGLSASSGAIANAWARATGLKPRSFPLHFPIDFTPFPPGALPTPVFVPLS